MRSYGILQVIYSCSCYLQSHHCESKQECLEILSSVMCKGKMPSTKYADFHHTNFPHPANICPLFNSFCSPYRRRGLEALSVYTPAF